MSLPPDPTYGFRSKPIRATAPFVGRSAVREVLGLRLPVASPEDVLQGKIWAASDPQRRGTKRRKDLLDIERILEANPDLRDRVPEEILRKIS